MARSTFTGPVKSNNGFEVPVVLTADLPTAADTTVNGAGDDEYCLVINTGAAWVTAVGAALS
jgi:hypothetical protein